MVQTIITALILGVAILFALHRLQLLRLGKLLLQQQSGAVRREE